MKKYFLTILLLFFSCLCFSQDVKNKKSSSYHPPREMSTNRFRHFLSMGGYSLVSEEKKYWVVKSSKGLLNKKEETPQYDTIYNSDMMDKKVSYPKRFILVNEPEKK